MTANQHLDRLEESLKYDRILRGYETPMTDGVCLHVGDRGEWASLNILVDGGLLSIAEVVIDGRWTVNDHGRVIPVWVNDLEGKRYSIPCPPTKAEN